MIVFVVDVVDDDDGFLINPIWRSFKRFINEYCCFIIFSFKLFKIQNFKIIPKFFPRFENKQTKNQHTFITQNKTRRRRELYNAHVRHVQTFDTIFTFYSFPIKRWHSFFLLIWNFLKRAKKFFPFEKTKNPHLFHMIFFDGQIFDQLLDLQQFDLCNTNTHTR